MSRTRYVFVGNRFYVLEEMLVKDLDLVRILAVKGSHLSRVLESRRIEFSEVGAKDELISILETTQFDRLVANGCPFILPVSRLAGGRRTFVNVHPAALPDLRGGDPVPGALLFGHESGATCHLMDDGIDTGGIISRVVVENTDDLDAGLLYQISFLAEKEVFNLALERDFSVMMPNAATPDCIYYTRRDADLVIDFAEPAETILRRVRAFSNRSQGARFEHRGVTFKVYRARQVRNPYLVERITCYAENEVVFTYEQSLLLRHGDAFLCLDAMDGDLSLIAPGEVLGAETGGVKPNS